MKKTEKNPKGAGRKKIELVQFKDLPQKQIVLEQVLYWINLQATAEEIAGSFFVSVDTLYRRLLEDYGFNYAELHKRVDGEGKLSLRRNQFKLSQKNATMAIWLGKIWLRQKEDMSLNENDIQKLKNLANFFSSIPVNKPQDSNGSDAVQPEAD